LKYQPDRIQRRHPAGTVQFCAAPVYPKLTLVPAAIAVSETAATSAATMAASATAQAQRTPSEDTPRKKEAAIRSQEPHGPADRTAKVIKVGNGIATPTGLRFISPSFAPHGNLYPANSGVLTPGGVAVAASATRRPN
jgi:hypothetical protein